jgi:hypothetical protein
MATNYSALLRTIPTSVSSGGGGAPTTATYVVEDANAGLSNEVLTTTVLNTGTVAALPAAVKAGRVYFPTDSAYLFRDTGAAQVPYGLIWRLTRPVTGDFAWVNQGSSTVTHDAGFAYLVAAGAASPNLRLRVKTAPATPYTITGVVVARHNGTAGLAGLCWRQSSDGKVITMALGGSGVNTLLVTKYTSETVLSAAYATVNVLSPAAPAFWFLRIQDNGTNRISSYSIDGYNWIVVHTVVRTDFMTADQVGWFVNANAVGQDSQASLFHWEQT